jgi:hypothetical protein
MNKIDNYLKRGIPAKIYLGAYGEKTTAYALSKIMPHPQSKINEWRKKMGRKYFKIYYRYEKGKKKIYFQSRPELLINEIEEQVGYLDPGIKLQIKKFLNSDFLSKYISLCNTDRDFSESIDAVNEITGVLGVMCVLYSGLQDYFDNSLDIKDWRKLFRMCARPSKKKALKRYYKRLKKESKGFKKYPLFHKYYVQYEEYFYDNIYSASYTIFGFNSEITDRLTKLVPQGMKLHSLLITAMSHLMVETVAMIEKYRYEKTLKPSLNT